MFFFPLLKTREMFETKQGSYCACFTATGSKSLATRFPPFLRFEGGPNPSSPTETGAGGGLVAVRRSAARFFLVGQHFASVFFCFLDSRKSGQTRLLSNLKNTNILESFRVQEELQKWASRAGQDADFQAVECSRGARKISESKKKVQKVGFGGWTEKRKSLFGPAPETPLSAPFFGL